MANPSLTPIDGAHESGVTEFDWVFTIGATGALTAETSYSGSNSTLTRGLKSVTRSTNGTYSFALNGAYVGTTNLSVIAHIQGTYTTTDGWICEVTTDSTTSTTAPLFVVTLYPSNGSSTTATDPKSGNRLHIFIRLKNSKS